MLVSVAMVTPVTSPPCPQDEALCGEYPGVLGRRAITTCKGEGPIGRYLTVQIPGEDEILVLCEVQVFGRGKYHLSIYLFIYLFNIITICLTPISSFRPRLNLMFCVSNLVLS